MMHVKNAILGGAAVLVMGCYKWAPATVETVPLNAPVQVLLTTEGQITLQERVGVNQAEWHGELLERDEEKILLSVPSTNPSPFSGVGGPQLYQRIDIPRADVARVNARELDGVKVAGMAAAAAGFGAIIVGTAFGGNNPGDTPNVPPEPQDHISGWIFGSGLRIP